MAQDDLWPRMTCGSMTPARVQVERAVLHLVIAYDTCCKQAGKSVLGKRDFGMGKNVVVVKRTVEGSFTQWTSLRWDHMP